MNHPLTPTQQEQLLRPINPSRVRSRDGMAYLEAWDVRAHLIRIFGFGGFSVELLDITQVFEQETTTRAGKAAFKVGYRATVRLTVPTLSAVYTEAAFGESVMPDFKRGDAHDMAIKTAESQALKRAATNLGTQFGLSLYNDGSMLDVVKATLAGPERAAEVVVVPVNAEQGTQNEREQVSEENVEQVEAGSLFDEGPAETAATVAQLARIDQLREELGFDAETFIDGVRKALGDNTILDVMTVSTSDADTLISRLERAAEARKANAA
jgi:hypothetical protein